jgi:DNA adenine methylase
MSFKSPLRYPGGKTRAVKILQNYAEEHFPGRTVLLSPFLGGGSFELSMVAKGCTVHGNDLFLSLYTFWKAAQEDAVGLANRVKEQMPVSKETFLELRRNILTSSEMARDYYIINRCSFSGATFCGGYSKQAADGRLTESSLLTLRSVDLSKVHLTNLDATAFLALHPPVSDTFVYADPPYYIETYLYGKDGDIHEGFDHAAFATALLARNDWILSYNDCEYIRTLYAGCRFFEAAWSYGMNKSKKSSELIILPPT